MRIATVHSSRHFYFARRGISRILSLCSGNRPAFREQLASELNAELEVVEDFFLRPDYNKP